MKHLNKTRGLKNVSRHGRIKLEKLSQRVLDYTLCEGACSAGIATVATLEGGPPSTDLSYVMPGARSAVVFAIPLDQDLIPGYLGKVDRPALEKNNETVNSIASGVAVKLANFMTQKGHPAVPLAANDVYRDDTPKGRVDMLPPVSLRYLAVASGVGCFGLSGNVLVKEHGGVVVQNPDGKLEAVAPEEACRRLDAMPAEVRAIYEGEAEPA